MYRALRRLDRGKGKIIEIGKPTRLQWLNSEQIAKLLEVGAVAEIHPPPLAELPGWRTRAKKLKSKGIEDAAQFLASEDAELARALRVKLPTVKRLKADVERWLTVEPGKRG